jgi:topoisomerase-4 subunit B
MSDQNQYTEDIRSLDWKEHIRMRPGMYIGKLGDGSSPDDGIIFFYLRRCSITVSMSSSWVQVKREVSIKDKNRSSAGLWTWYSVR